MRWRWGHTQPNPSSRLQTRHHGGHLHINRNWNLRHDHSDGLGHTKREVVQTNIKLPHPTQGAAAIAKAQAFALQPHPALGIEWTAGVLNRAMTRAKFVYA